MKLQRTTLILLFLALGLGSFVYFHEQGANDRRSPALVKEQEIFSFTVEQVQSLSVKTKEQTLLLEREDKSGQLSWLMKAPTRTPASAPAVSYLMDLLVKGNERTIQVPATQLQEYGLDQPQATIGVKLKNQQTHQLILGKPNFNHSFLYAQADPPAKLTGNVNVLLVSTDFENAVNRPLSEWKSPDASKGDRSGKSFNTPKPKESIKASPSPSPLQPH